MLHALIEYWHQLSWIEFWGVVTGLLCVALAAMNNIWNWPMAIISVILYIYIFYNSQLYADMGLQVYFLVVNIYGWYFWSKHADDEVKTPVKLINRKEVLWSIAVIIVFTPLLGFTLIKLAPILHYKPAAYPYLDSFCTAGSVVAQIFLARKVLQNWLIWIFVDIIYVGVYIVKNLEATAFMYGVYVIIALLGYLDWRKDYHRQILS